MSAQVWLPPAAIAATPRASRETLAGNRRSPLLPSPSCPEPLSPQQRTPPARLRAQVWFRPAATATAPRASSERAVGRVRVFVVPSPSCPATFRPQHLTAPRRVSAQVCWPPAAIAVTPLVSPETEAGTARFAFVPSPSCPYRLSPQHSTAPALVSPQAWAPPAAIAATPLATTCGLWPSPQHSTSPPFVRAQVNEPPAATALTPGTTPTTTGSVRSAFVPSPTWPAAFAPQQSRKPRPASAQVCEPPAETACALASRGTAPGPEAAPGPAHTRRADAPSTQSSR